MPMAGNMKKKDVLLSNIDIPEDDEKFFTEIPAEEFAQSYADGGIIKFLNKRIIAILPFKMKTDDQTVIPIPFIVDTGCPSYLCFGKGARDLLTDRLKILIPDPKKRTDLHGDIEILNGTLQHNKDHYLNPIVSGLPTKWLEEDRIWEKPQANILGFLALSRLPSVLIQSGQQLAEQLATQQNSINND